MKKIFITLLLIASYSAPAQVLCIANSSSLSFNGTSNFVEFTNDGPADITDSITVEAWIRPLTWGVTSANGSILCKHGWSAGEAGYVLRCGGTGELSFNIGGIDSLGNPTSWQEIISPAAALAPYLNAWVHVAGTYDGNDLKIYINGVLSNTKHFKGSIVPSPNYHIHLSRLADDGQPAARYFNGKIDEVRLWHRALSQAEIFANKGVHIDPALQSQLVGYWRLNENTGSTVADLSGNNITGTITGATWGTIVPFNNLPIAPVITNIAFSTLHSSASSNIQWNLNGVPLAGDTLQNLVYTQNGTYTVTLTNAVGCSSTSLPFNIVNAGLSNYTNSNDITLHPNPASGIVTIRINAAAAFNMLQLTDITGKVLITKTIDISNAGKLQIELSTYKPGVYFVKLSGDLKVATQKLFVE